MYFSWKYDLYKCFKLTCLKSTDGNKVFDLARIDIYGRFYKTQRDFYNEQFHGTIKIITFNIKSLFYSLFILI